MTSYSEYNCIYKWYAFIVKITLERDFFFKSRDRSIEKNRVRVGDGRVPRKEDWRVGGWERSRENER
jgi:hypothetical protein